MKTNKHLYRIAIGGLLLAAATIFASMPGYADVPPDTSPTIISTVPSISMPPYLSPIIEPTFDTTLVRITDHDVMDTQYSVIRNAYAKTQPWNADGSLIALNFSSYPGAILDGRTYEFIKWGAVGTLWSNVDPHIMYTATSKFNPIIKDGVEWGTSLITIDPLTEEWTQLHEFPDCDTISFMGEGNLSADDRYAALFCVEGSDKSAIVYDILNDQVVSTLDLLGHQPDWLSMSQSGNYVVFDWSPAAGTGRYQGAEVFDINLNFLRQISTYGSHGDIGYDVNGNEVLVLQTWDGQSSDPDAGIVSIRLDNGATTDVLDKVTTRTANGIHISCRNFERPGWCYVSDYAVYNPNAYAVPLFEYNEVFALKLDGSETIERFAHTRASGLAVLDDYSSLPFAVPNRDGSKVLFGTDWYEAQGVSKAMKLTATAAGQYGATQTIAMNGSQPDFIRFGGYSKTENVSGAANSDFGVTVDIHYTDSTSVLGESVSVPTGTHDWLWFGAKVEVTKPIDYVVVTAALRNKTGTAWMDNIFLTEEDTNPNNNTWSLLDNFGFEDGAASWTPLTDGFQIADTGHRITETYVTEKKGDNQVMRMHAATGSEQHYARQTLTLNRTVGTLTVSGKSKADGVSGAANSDYSVYVDVNYADGSNLFGQTANFAAGTHDWQTATYTFAPNPAKTVSTIKVYAMFRNKSGTVWFDDLSLTENGGANLLTNADFQQGHAVPLSGWTPGAADDYGLDQTSQIIKMSSGSTAESRWAKQAVTLNRPVGPITISGWSKADQVSGAKNSDYALYVDVNYSDSTNLFAQTVNFATGTHDWEYGTYTFTPNPAKTVSTIQFYVMFRNKTGTVWFEDVRMTEAHQESNLLANPGFNTGSSVPLANWSYGTSQPYTLTYK